MIRPIRPRRLLPAALVAGLIAIGTFALAPAAYAETTTPADQASSTSVGLTAECIEGRTIVTAKIQLDVAVSGEHAEVWTSIDGDTGHGWATSTGYYETWSAVTPGVNTATVIINTDAPIVKTIDSTKTCSPEPTPTPTETATPTPTPTPTPSTEPTQTPAPAATPTASLSRSTAAPDTQLTVTGSGFTAGESIELWLHSTPVKLATVTAAADGSFSQVVTIPEGTEPGAHTVEVRSANSGSISLALSVVPGLAVTGANDAVLLPLSGGAVALVLGGAALLVARRRRVRA